MKQNIVRIIESKTFKKITLFLIENKKVILTFLIAAIFFDIFIIRNSFDIVIFSILFLYGVFVIMSDLNSKRTFMLCIGLLVVMFINFFLSGTSVQTEKAAVWLFLFLALGIIQQWKESY